MGEGQEQQVHVAFLGRDDGAAALHHEEMIAVGLYDALRWTRGP